MDLTLWAALIAVFAFSFLLIYGFLSAGIPWVSQRASTTTEPVVTQVVTQLESLGRRVQGRRLPFLRDVGDELNWRSSKLALLCIQAGYRSYNAVLIMLGAKLVSAVMGLFFGVLLALELQAATLGLIAIGLVIAAAGFWLPDLVLRALVKRRQREFLDHFPDALDLIRICLEAGLGLDAAIIRVGEEFRKICPALQDEFHTLSLELRAGASRTQCLRNFAHRTGLPEVQAFVTLLIQADRFGTGIADAVKVHCEQLRLNRKLKAEEAAAKVSVKLLFPLIFFIFPALLLVLLGPAAISFYENVVGGVLGR